MDERPVKVEDQPKGAGIFDAPSGGAVEPQISKGAGIYDRPVASRPTALYVGMGIVLLLIVLFAIYALRTYT